MCDDGNFDYNDGRSDYGDSDYHNNHCYPYVNGDNNDDTC